MTSLRCWPRFVVSLASKRWGKPFAPPGAPWLSQHQPFLWEEGALRWQVTDKRPAAGEGIDAPSDPEAQDVKTRENDGVGDHVQMTETCEESPPHLMTQVETTSAPVSDLAALPLIHEALPYHDLFPERPLVETGSVDGEAVVTSQAGRWD